MLARESTATITPSLKMKASVVVPCAGFTISMTSRSKESTCTRNTDVEHVEVAAFTCEHVRLVEVAHGTHVVDFWERELRCLWSQVPLWLRELPGWAMPVQPGLQARQVQHRHAG